MSYVLLAATLSQDQAGKTTQNQEEKCLLFLNLTGVPLMPSINKA